MFYISILSIALYFALSECPLSQVGLGVNGLLIQSFESSVFTFIYVTRIQIINHSVHIYMFSHHLVHVYLVH